MYLVHYIWNMLLFKKCKLCQIFFTLIRALTPARPEYQHWLLTSSQTQWKLSCLSPLSANSLGQALQLQNWPWGALTVITHMIVADSWYTTEESVQFTTWSQPGVSTWPVKVTWRVLRVNSRSLPLQQAHSSCCSLLRTRFTLWEDFSPLVLCHAKSHLNRWMHTKTLKFLRFNLISERRYLKILKSKLSLTFQNPTWTYQSS